MDCLKIGWTKNGSQLQNLRNSGAVGTLEVISQTRNIHCGLTEVLVFFFTDEEIDLQFIGECQDIAELILAAAIKLFPAVAVVIA